MRTYHVTKSNGQIIKVEGEGSSIKPDGTLFIWRCEAARIASACFAPGAWTHYEASKPAGSRDA